jgi:putative DNA primase/helicase
MPDGQKWFWSGATTKGAHYIIDRKGAVLTLLCEGLATGLTLFAAVPDSRVIVAFNSGNLEHVAKIVQIHGMCAVCADNDAATFERIGKNPGFDSATKAASTLGAGVALPECEAGTDFNDMLSEKLAALKEANLFRQGYKHTPAQILAEANATIRSRVMAGARFIAHAETITVTEKPTGEVCPKCWKEGRSLWARSCACLPGWPNFTTNQEKNNTL